MVRVGLIGEKAKETPKEAPKPTVEVQKTKETPKVEKPVSETKRTGNRKK